MGGVSRKQALAGAEEAAMPVIRIDNLEDWNRVSPREAALVKGGPIEIRELTIKVEVKQ